MTKTLEGMVENALARKSEEYRQIAVGKIQVWAEATLTGKAITEKDLREWLLPKCAQADLNSDTFEYLAAYLAKKLELKS